MENNLPQTEDGDGCPKTPVKPRYSDRFMPTRDGHRWNLTFPITPSRADKVDLGQEDSTESANKRTEEVGTGEKTYSCLLKNEMLGYDYDASTVLSSPRKSVSRKLFTYDSMERLPTLSSYSPFSPSPVSSSSENLLRTPVPQRRRISKNAYKVLDAPALVDDFYLNLLDWSKRDVVCVGLGTQVYSWDAGSSNVSLVANLQSDDNPTSVKWNEKGNIVAIGSQAGVIRLWDAEAEKMIMEKQMHDQRIGTLDWNGTTLFSGSRDKRIKMMDIRTQFTSHLGSHSQEVCGLKWSSFNACLASGGNDNVITLWNINSQQPIAHLKDHIAAVKALSWSPHERHILASGGGTSDRSLKFWNTITGTCLQSLNTESQVCNVIWSPHSRELVSSHGFANNHVAVWKYPSLKPVATLKGHQQRVLYMALSPDGNCVCTGAADETLRFWKVFEKNLAKVRKSSLDLFEGIR